jgi:hypothetical protein
MNATLVALASVLAAAPAMGQIDSIVLERTLDGFDGGHAYRVSVSREGVVHFQVREPDGQVLTSRVATKRVGGLVTRMQMYGLLKLPDDIGSDSSFGGRCATDQDTVTVEIFFPTWSKRIRDYQGCAWAPWALRDFEAQIDSITGVSGRWPTRN